MNRSKRETRYRRQNLSQLSDRKRRRVVRETVAAMTETRRLALAISYYKQVGPEGVADSQAIGPEEINRLRIRPTTRVTRTLIRGDKECEAGPRSAAWTDRAAKYQAIDRDP